ncbi:uncharacterized protein N7487_002993 [Penicillium crustosum]|uniref:uncharacterized protein n=1 Tax=Penicillium crustosum TaxID=36656 RepID=UPI0023A328AE|nr:uncharacterized protein N7487_002973 [Penicillium crustosum]XP_056735524.1 uncharacterized protein N7487_002993 [Penicillium crustosum]KAJ5419423.1 hypothetical protein N7487_002973 [Penicillium crustosum]KAJ5419443.1 hypothetical protein N7487_002993 [Penicillium crustosum]
MPDSYPLIQPRLSAVSSLTEEENTETSLHKEPRQRCLKSCRECSRRKIKCDRKIPCRACIERGEAELCRRQLPLPAKHQVQTRYSSTVPPAIQAELDSLRSRLERVESAISLRSSTPQPQFTDAEEFNENGLAGAIEEAALGIGEKRRWQGSSLLLAGRRPSESVPSRWFSSIPFSTCLLALPRRHESQKLLKWYCEHLDYLCACLHQPTLVQQHDTFWTDYEQQKPQDGMVLALLFAVLSTSAFFLDEEQAQLRGFDHQEL